MNRSGSSIAWPLRAWIAVEICFGLAAMASIALRPQDTALNFAWTIKSEVHAAFLGALYMSSAWVFVVAVFAKRWEMIRVLVIPVILFTSAELLATVLHWDRFALWTPAFNIWFASYLLPPGIFAACYWWQQRRAIQHAGAEPNAPLHPELRGLMAVLGAALLIAGVLAFIWPALLMAVAPWPFTPLTTRATCGWLAMLGAMLLSCVYENDLDRTRIVSPFFVLLLPAAAWQVMRFPAQVNSAHPGLWVGALILALVCAIGLYLARGDWRKTLT